MFSQKESSASNSSTELFNWPSPYITTLFQLISWTPCNQRNIDHFCFSGRHYPYLAQSYCLHRTLEVQSIQAWRFLPDSTELFLALLNSQNLIWSLTYLPGRVALSTVSPVQSGILIAPWEPPFFKCTKTPFCRVTTLSQVVPIFLTLAFIYSVNKYYT